MTPQSEGTSTRLEQYPLVVAVAAGHDVNTEGADTVTDRIPAGAVVVDPSRVRGAKLDDVLRDAGEAPVFIDADDMPAVVAVTALAAKAGVRAVVTSLPSAARDAVDMVASIERRRPPARTVRGLA